jgi:nucleoside-diphosphate-sugar epimerase
MGTQRARMKHLLCFGFGFTAEHLAKILPGDEWRISGTARTVDGVQHIKAVGVEGFAFERLDEIPADITHILCSIAPDEYGCPAALKFRSQLQRPLKWTAYLSTTGVYGNHDGGWVNEDTPLTPSSARARRRVLAEQQWQEFGAHIFRLPGIYGPGRSQLDSVKDGTARRIIKPNQIFSRIHVEDIASILAASIAKPHAYRIYNVADDEPSPPQDVVAYAAQLLGVAPPPEIKFEEANLSPMARSFYDDSKRVSNARIKSELGITLKYPNFRVGLRSLL